MKCPICNNELNKSEEICPKCGITIKEKTIQKDEIKNETKIRQSNFLYYTRIISIIVAVIAGVIALAAEYYAGVAEVIIAELILCIALKTFETIIDLLQSIDNKLK